MYEMVKVKDQTFSFSTKRIFNLPNNICFV